MRRISPKTKALDLTRFPDGHGLYFDEVRDHVQKHYGMRVADWPKVVRQVNPNVCRIFHGLFKTCWNCGGDKDVQAHHGCAGYLRGRSDELTLMFALCGDFGNGCHGMAGTTELPHGKLLRLKWEFDREHLSWVRVALVWGRFLPDLILDEELVTSARR